jgi:hypothetical protein
MVESGQVSQSGNAIYGRLLRIGSRTGFCVPDSYTGALPFTTLKN